MEKKKVIKHRVLVQFRETTCCGPASWEHIGTTYDPISYQAEHPTWILKFEPCILK